MDEIKAGGIQVIGVSHDTKEILEKFSKKKSVKFPLLADPKSEVIKKFKLMNTRGRAGTRYHLIAYPMTVLLDKDGVVKGKLPGTVVRRHGGKQLVSAWKKIQSAK